MHRFITGLSKIPAKRKSKTDEEKRERHNVYDTTKRQRVYLPEWERNQPWLQHERANKLHVLPIKKRRTSKVSGGLVTSKVY